MTDIPKQYDPLAAQNRWFPYWESRGDFNADPDPDRPPHTIMIPLPNVTGALHMGHALNGTCQDLITRWRRMQGYEALWMPGTDHAGIATQAVVERRMFEEEGLTRHDIGREALVQRIWRWKDDYETRIVAQLKSIGASCDWRRIRFTLDEVCSRAVRRTFFKMFSDGLIYRGKRLVNWDVHLQTAVADDEVFHEETQGHFWTFNYPVVDAEGQTTGETIRFSTTRPETMLGDTAVCVHPTDERYTHLVGRQVRIPLNGRLIPIIADGLLADKDLGTGAVKVTPAHDPNDYQCGLRNGLAMINILNSDGTINAEGGEWQGQDRYACRESVVQRMTELGHFEQAEDRIIPIMHSDRSKTPIEPYLSDQWFVRMGEGNDGKPGLAQMAMDAVTDGRVRFYPSRYSKTYLDWLGEKRDWCISRQLWWGHQIPVWSASGAPAREFLSTHNVEVKEGSPRLEFPLNGAGNALAGEWSLAEDGEFRVLICVTVGREDLESDLERRGFRRDPDVLDTWFSSALWPHATLGWPDLEHNPPLDAAEVAKQAGRPATDVNATSAGGNEVLDYFYPGNVLITSRDIITLWVARMVLTGLYNLGDVPFQHVHVHPKILDGFGQTMSKSKGNGVDPVDLIAKYGTDAVRFSIASFAGETQDVRLPIAYECPQCETLIPQTLEHQKAKPDGGVKPTVLCPQCKTGYQYTSPGYDPDPDVPVARMVSERFEYGRNFCNKFWNSARFAMLNLTGYEPDDVAPDQLAMEDRWILSRLSTVVRQVDESLGRYQFDFATRTLREFTWNEFCDWYLEMIKPRLRDEQTRPVAQRVLLAVLDTLVRLLQPFTPFICEDIWQRLREIAPERSLPACEAQGPVLVPQRPEEACIVASWPRLPDAWRDPSLEQRFARLQETIVAVRNVRAVYNIPPATPIRLLMRTTEDMQSVAGQFDNLAKAVLEAAGADIERPAGAASFSLGDASGYIPLEGLIDRAAELDRQQKEAEKLRKHIAGHEAKLGNESFVSKAPEQVVSNVRDTLAALKEQLTRVEDIVADLS